MVSSHGRLESAELLLNRGADVHHRVLLTGSTSLHVAFQNGHQDVARLLLDHDADANAQRKGWRWTPLHLASDNGKLEVGQVQYSSSEPRMWTRGTSMAGRRCVWHREVAISNVGRLTCFCSIAGPTRTRQTSHQMTRLHFAVCNGHFQVA